LTSLPGVPDRILSGWFIKKLSNMLVKQWPHAANFVPGRAEVKMQRSTVRLGQDPALPIQCIRKKLQVNSEVREGHQGSDIVP
jgi:hypothetical protein